MSGFDDDPTWHRIRMKADVGRAEEETSETTEWESSGIRSKSKKARPSDPIEAELGATGEVPAIDKIIGDRYVLREMLGIGGMGAVVSAVDTQTGREVALKLLRSAGGRETRARRMRREAENARQIASAYVPRVDEMFIDGSEPFIVMERLHGETLRDRLRRDGPLPFEEAIAITSQLLDALEEVHQAGVVHRDVKPANVFITDGTVKLIDFGLAARPGDLATNDAARVESLNAFGTLDYLPPERLLEQHDVDHRGDIWSAGITLYAALTGTHPFLRDQWKDQVQATLLDDPPAISELRPDVPAAIDDVICRALAKEREWRYPSARAFGIALCAAAYA
jgi:eukaryotic-like serine/threonine-protein kinase